MNSNFWISSINSNHEDREKIAIRFTSGRFRSLVNIHYLDDFVVVSDFQFSIAELEEIIFNVSG